ncbi:FMN reductase [NAD(P)H], partial [termite gut metagenome]
MKSIRKRTTIRKYQSKEIPSELLHKLLETSFRASNTGNMQAYSVIIT